MTHNVPMYLKCLGCMACRAGYTFLTHCLPFLLLLAKAQPATVCPALEQSSALQQLFGSNLKLGSPAARQAARQLLLLMYQQGQSLGPLVSILSMSSVLLHEH